MSNKNNYIIIFLSLLIFLSGMSAFAADRVLTIYLCGTGIKSDAYLGSRSAFKKPELLTSLYALYDSSVAIEHGPYDWTIGAWPPLPIDGDDATHYKFIVNGAGTNDFNLNPLDILSALLGNVDPNFGARNWHNIKVEAINALIEMQHRYSGDDITLNLLGFSRGGISALMVAHDAAEYDWVKKINIFGFDPVPGGLDPVAAHKEYFTLPKKVNQYIGIYAEHERTWMFEPVIPVVDSNSTTKRLLIRLPGSHETIVGNRQKNGHSTAWFGLFPVEVEDYKYVGNLSQVIVEQLLRSDEWGNVPLKINTDIGTDGVDTKDEFTTIVDKIWSLSYTDILITGFLPLFGTHDICYTGHGRDHELRASVPWPVFNTRLSFVGTNRGAPGWQWGNCFFTPVLFLSAERVYWLNNIAARVSSDHWDVLQNYSGNPTVDTLAPVPNIAELPDINADCSILLSTPPTATDNTAGTVNGTTDIYEFNEQGTFEITWSYDDGQGNISTQNQTLIINDTIAPYPENEFLDTLTAQCEVTIDTPPTAFDNCSGEIIGTTSDPLTYHTQGEHIVTWQFEDENSNISTYEQVVIIEDTEAPIVEEVIASKLFLWPPNHKMIPVTFEVNATDNCDGIITSRVMSIKSNEPLNGKGDGNTDHDWKLIDDLSIELRAERSGNNKLGRVYTIRIETSDYSGNTTISTVNIFVRHDISVTNIDSEIGEATLHQNSPNPFNPSTMISYDLPTAEHIKLEIYNIRGQKVTTLVDAYQTAGYHSVRWDASNKASGIYLYKIQAGDFLEIKKMSLLK